MKYSGNFSVVETLSQISLVSIPASLTVLDSVTGYLDLVLFGPPGTVVRVQGCIVSWDEAVRSPLSVKPETLGNSRR